MSSLQTRACSIKGPGGRGGRGSPTWPVLCVGVVLGYDVGRNGGPDPSSTLPGLVWGSGCRQGPGTRAVNTSMLEPRVGLWLCWAWR